LGRASHQECGLFLLFTTSSPGDEEPPGSGEDDRSRDAREKWPKREGGWRDRRDRDIEAEPELDWLMLGAHASNDQGVMAEGES
jgi:hypothetical protein